MKLKAFLLVCLLSVTATSCAQKETKKMVFNMQRYQTKTLTLQNKTFRVRAYENIVYVEKPVDTSYQIMNIYIPEAFFEGKNINGYTVDNAPIFFPNQVGGYMPAKPATIDGSPAGMFPPPNGQLPKDSKEQLPPGGFGPRVNTVVEALSHGYIVASAGARGRTMKHGKAPAGIVDLKAAVRYLKFNDSRMPGDAKKIISNGTSAGGAMSTLLGATGNNAEYEPYLKALGAANATDDIYGVSTYCPITNLDHADIAYEWQFNGVYTYKRGGPMAGPNANVQTLAPNQMEVSRDLAKAFPAYVNSMQLKDDKGNLLTLQPDGNGSFKDWVKSFVIASANKAISDGQNLLSHTWLTFTNGKVSDLDWDQYIVYMERQKTPPAFDALNLSSPENQEFGTESIDKQHFTEYGTKHSTMESPATAGKQIVKMMNPMYYIGAPNTSVTRYWRIRHGSKDKDGSLAIPVLLGTLLGNKGYEVNLELPWDKPHSGDYDLKELFAWIDTICQSTTVKK